MSTGNLIFEKGAGPLPKGPSPLSCLIATHVFAAEIRLVGRSSTWCELGGSDGSGTAIVFMANSWHA